MYDKKPKIAKLSLIEVLVIALIVAILAAIAIPIILNVLEPR